MQTNVEIQHKHVYSVFIGSLCNKALSMERFTCSVTSQVFVKFWMQGSKGLSSAFYRGRENIYE